MTDNEIIKALKHNASKCKFYEDGYDDGLFESTLALINRQKAENESLKVDLAKCSIRLDNLYETADEIKSEAIKEFAHLVIERSRNGVIQISDIPDLVKEMTEENK